ncbi:MAG: O-antigen ligase family protein [Bacteroidales bacterium]|nr:O-antigen ligase family protein [Bacteroidales bacterium]
MKQNIKRKTVQKKAQNRETKNWFYYVFFGVLFSLLPLVYYRSSLDPAIHPRLLFISVLLIPALLYLFWIKRKSDLNTSVLYQPVFWFLSAYALITAVSMAFAINPGESYYDINKSFSVVILAGISSILFLNTRDWQKWFPLFFILPAIILLVVGAMDYYKYVLFATTPRTPENLEWIYEVRGNMAHKNQYSISLMLLLPLLGFGIYKNAGLLKWLSAFVSVLILIFIIVLQTRSVWVGIAVSVFTASILIIIFAPRFNIGKGLRMSVGIGLLALIISIGSVVYFSKTVEKNSIIFKLKNITNPKDGNNIHRVKIWDLTTKMIRDYPIQGVGAGNWKIVSHYYFPGYNFTKDQLNWLRPHNDFLWVFSEKGIFGFLAFIGIFITVFIYFIKIVHSHLAIGKKVLALLLVTGMTGYLAVSFFTFPLERMNHQIYLAVILAAITALYHEAYGNKAKVANVRLLSGFAILLMTFSVVYALSDLKMETMVKKARNLHKTAKWEELNKLAAQIPVTFKTTDTEAMPIAWYSGLSYASLGKIPEANQAYLEAFRQNPSRTSVLNNLGRTYFQLEDYENAKIYFEKALLILPDYFESLVNLSSTYIQLHDYQNALNCLNKIPPGKLNEPLKKNLKFVQRKLREQGTQTDAK